MTISVRDVFFTRYGYFESRVKIFDARTILLKLHVRTRVHTFRYYESAIIIGHAGKKNSADRIDIE